MTASPATHSPSRGRIIGARVLLVVGVILLVVSILSTYVKREALDQGQFEQTSRELIAKPCDPGAAVGRDGRCAVLERRRLGRAQGEAADEPAGARRPAGRPLAGLRGHGGAEASRPAARAGHVRRALPSASQAQLVKVLHGDTKGLTTTNGNVVLDLRPLVLRLGDRFGFVSNLADKVPQDSAQITILKSDDLETAQNVTHFLEQMANFVWIFAVAAWVGAIWLARGRRRQEVRSLGIGLVAVGDPRPARAVHSPGSTSSTTSSSTNRLRPAATDAWQIITKALAASGWVALVVGILVAIGAWLVGPGERATSARAAVAPTLRRTGLAWGAFVAG